MSTQPTEPPSPLAKRQLSTTMAGLRLQELTVADAQVYYGVLDRNRAHLSEYGDYQDEANATLAWVIDLKVEP